MLIKIQGAVPTPPVNWTAREVLTWLVFLLIFLTGGGFFGNYILKKKDRAFKKEDDAEAKKTKAEEKEEAEEKARKAKIDELDKELDSRILERLQWQDKLIDRQSGKIEEQGEKIEALLKAQVLEAIAKSKLEIEVEKMKALVDLANATAADAVKRFQECHTDRDRLMLVIERLREDVDKCRFESGKNTEELQGYKMAFELLKAKMGISIEDLTK